MRSKNKLANQKIIVIGAGPAGLAFAKAAQQNGAEVRTFEKYGDPRGSNAGYTDRSFNLTLNNAGRNALNDSRVWRGGGEVVGRAIHRAGSRDEVVYASYGEGDSALLTSVPRPTLRQNLIGLAEKTGVIIKFDTKVLSLRPDEGIVTIQPGNRSLRDVQADLIVVADGLHSLGDAIIQADLGGELQLHPEPYNYVTVVLDRDACRGLSLRHIHFWHERKQAALSIGVPNKDGTIAVLMISTFSDVPEGQSPFADLAQSTERINRDFPQLLSLDPTLPERLIGRLRGRFYYKSVTNYVLGNRCVVVGDAGNTVPPWAAFGANAALYCADALVRFLVGCPGDMGLALKSYEEHARILADLIIDFVDQHGKFLMNDVVEHPGEHSSSPVLGELINKAISHSSVPPGVELLSF